MRRLQLQLIFVLLAAISVSALSVALISSAVRGAEGVVLSDTHKALDAANSELDQQYAYRVDSDSSWPGLPAAAQDISLRGISQAVLRSYPGVEGGFFAGTKILGYSFPTHGSSTEKIDVPEAELSEILAVIRQSLEAGRASRVLRGARDLVVIQAIGHNRHVSWTMKRIPGITDPGEKRRNMLLIWLVIAALVSVGGTLATVIGLRRGITEVQSGLARLETDLDFQLPIRGGELGGISQSVNRVAATRRALEAEVRREDRLRAIGRLSANIAHEIRNPLNGIRLSMQMLKQRLTRHEIRQNDLDLVTEEVDRLNALLSDLLAFRKAQQPSLQKQPVLPIVERCLRLIEVQARERGIDVGVHGGDFDNCARVDEKQLTQVLTNLLLNSLAAIPGEGRIDVRVSRERESISIEVQDTGPGVPFEHREHLFEAFYTTRSEGTGLGLAVSRELVQGMGGTLIYRDSGPGARFVINLPAQEAATHETGSGC